MKENFLFDIGQTYISYVPKCYRHICKSTANQKLPKKDARILKRINRTDAEILRYIEFKVLGRFVNDDNPTIEEIEQPIKLSNAQVQNDLDYDPATIADSLRRLQELGYIYMFCKVTRNGEGYDSDRRVALRCENIMHALNQYFSEVLAKQRKDKKAKSNWLKIQEGYLSKVIQRRQEEQSAENARQLDEKIEKITSEMFIPRNSIGVSASPF